jgi:hypothetical protein
MTPLSPKICAVGSKRSCAAVYTAALAALSCLHSADAEAHPVVFEQGTAIMGHHHGDMAALEVIHSPRWWYGLGIEAERTKDSSIVLARANALVWRGNFPDLQSNLYLGLDAGMAWGPMTGHGGAHHRSTTNLDTSREGERSRVQAWRIEWDAEDRQFYGKGRFTRIFKDERAFSNETVTRLGLAPYKAQAEEPALWTMLEWTTNSDSKFRVTEHEITPLVRYFYRNMLFEVGSSLSGKLTFNYMIHYF